MDSTDLTQEEINEIKWDGKPDALFCQLLVHYMMGYLAHADNIENTRQDFFKQIKRHLDEKCFNSELVGKPNKPKL